MQASSRGYIRVFLIQRKDITRLDYCKHELYTADSGKSRTDAEARKMNKSHSERNGCIACVRFNFLYTFVANCQIIHGKGNACTSLDILFLDLYN